MQNHKSLAVVALVVVIVFLTIIIVHPRIFNPQNIGRTTAPAPSNVQGSVPLNSVTR